MPCSKLYPSLFQQTPLRWFTAVSTFTNARQRGGTDDVVTFLANKTNLLGILKRKYKDENPSPLIFIPMLLTGFSNP